MKPLDILSLGAGVQSTAVLLMSCEGELPKLDHAVFADTGWEPAAVYQHLDWLTEVATTHGIPVSRVKAGNIRQDALISQVRGKKTNGHRFASMPLFTRNPEDPREGMIRRQCTREYKIDPINRFIRGELLDLQPRQRAPEKAVRQWFGISRDEWHRMRDSDAKWRTHYYPLIEKEITRAGCLEWIHDRGYPEPPRSACIGCPYHADAEWRDMKLTRPEEFADACEADDAIRNCGGMRGKVYLHRSCQPLRDVDFRNDFDKGQLSLFSNECSGMCGV